jgi:hypothetical protein
LKLVHHSTAVCPADRHTENVCGAFVAVTRAGWDAEAANIALKMEEIPDI